MSSELSVGGKLAKAATELLNEMDPDTYLDGIAPLLLALEEWAMAKTLPSDTALRRAGLYLERHDNGCNEVKTLRRLVEAAQCGDPAAWMLEGMVGGSDLAFQQSDLQDSQNRYGGELVPLYRHAAEPVGMQGMETAPRDGTHILIKTSVSLYSSGPPHYGYHVVGTSWEECRFVDGKFQRWCGDDRTYSSRAIEPLGWAPIPHETAPEPRTVELPSFEGYQANIVRELQAAFVQACEKANIKVRTL